MMIKGGTHQGEVVQRSWAWLACYINHPVSWADTSAVPHFSIRRHQGFLIGTLVGSVPLSHALERKGLESVQIDNTACSASCFQPVRQGNAFLWAVIPLCPNEEKDAPRDCLFHNKLLVFRTTTSKIKTNRTEQNQGSKTIRKAEKSPLKTHQNKTKVKREKEGSSHAQSTSWPVTVPRKLAIVLNSCAHWFTEDWSFAGARS